MINIQRIWKRASQICLAVFLAGLMTFLGLPVATAQAASSDTSSRLGDLNKQGVRPYDEQPRHTGSSRDLSNRASQSNPQKVQSNAKNLGNNERSGGDTGMQTIRKLGENISDTFNPNSNPNNR